MDRRGFLKLLGAGAAAAIVAPEIVRAYFLPPNGGWTHLRLPPYVVTEEALADNLYNLSGDGVSLYSMAHPFSNTLSEHADLNEAALEQICFEMQEPAGYIVQPTRRIVSPAEYRFIQRVQELDAKHDAFEALPEVRRVRAWLAEKRRVFA